MPLYDYICNHCDNSFSELRRTTEIDSPINCPECGKMETSRLLSCFSVGVNRLSKVSERRSANSQFRWAV